MSPKIIGAAAAAILALATAIGAFAFQSDVLGTGSSPTTLVPIVGTDTATATATSTGIADTPTSTSTPTATSTAATTTATPTASAPGEGGGERDIKGIPTTNPNHHPESTPGVCVKGETAVKTTPSGEMVNVPCQAVDKTHGTDADAHDPEGHNDDDTVTATPTP